MNTKESKNLILENNYDDIVSFIDLHGKPEKWYSYRDMARLAVRTMRAGREGNAVRALMAKDFTFVGIASWNSHGYPQCALNDLCTFAANAQSRFEEAQSMASEVFDYELLRTEHVPGKILPITHSRMQKLKKHMELVLGRPSTRRSKRKSRQISLTPKL